MIFFSCLSPWITFSKCACAISRKHVKHRSLCILFISCHFWHVNLWLKRRLSYHRMLSEICYLRWAWFCFSFVSNDVHPHSRLLFLYKLLRNKKLNHRRLIACHSEGWGFESGQRPQSPNFRNRSTASSGGGEEKAGSRATHCNIL